MHRSHLAPIYISSPQLSRLHRHRSFILPNGQHDKLHSELTNASFLTMCNSPCCTISCLMDAAKQNVGRIVVSSLILRILALIHCWIYEHSPTYIFLLTSSRWKLLTEINKYWPGCRQLAWFPRHRVLPTHSWTTVTVKLQTFQPHIHLNCRSTSKLSHSIPWIRPQKDALLLSIALSKPHLRTIAPNVFLAWKLCLSFAMALSNTWNSFLSKI